MSTARTGATADRMGRVSRGGWDSPAGANGWKWGVAAAVLALGIVAAWWAGFFGRGRIDPRVAEILAMQAQASRQFAANGGPATPAEAAASVEATMAIMQKIGELPEEVREQAESSGRWLFMAAMRANIDRYFALPPEKRQAELDRQIRQSELMRQAWESSRAAAGPGGGGQGGRGGPSGQAGQRGGGPPRSRTEEDRNRWRKEMIDRTSPEGRARYAEYRRAMENRREELGLPAPTRGPR